MIFKPQKVLSLKDELAKKKPKLQGEYILTEKIDGWYVYFEYINGVWHTPKSSAGRPIPAFEWMDLTTLPKYNSDAVLIAEAYIPDCPFFITNGIFNRSIGDYHCKDVKFIVHDIVQNDYLQRANVRFQHTFRFEELRYFDRPEVLLLSTYNEKLWLKTFESVVENNGEGIVAKRVDSFYSPGKRNADLLKLKLECTIDALAVRLEESIGDKGLTALTLVSQRANGIEIRTVIGKHEDQKRFKEDSTSIIGKVVEIKGMEVYDDGQVRQPVFKHVREDKRIGDID